jgi:predicted kinase
MRSRPLAVFLGGPPASGKTTLGRALAPALHAALLDLDVATGPLTHLVMTLLGARDLSEPGLAELTRGPRYETLLALTEDVTRAGISCVVVAPFTDERNPARWAAIRTRLEPHADAVLVWLSVPAAELSRRLAARAAARDADKLGDVPTWLAGIDLTPPAAPHVLLDAGRPVAELVENLCATLR